MDIPFKRLPKRFIIELVKRAAIMINSLPLDNGIHDAMSPRAIVTGKVLQIPPCKVGEYVQAKVPTTNKTDEERTVDALYIGPNNNSTGHYMFKLKTKEGILVPKVTPLPIPESVIKVVNEMGGKEGQVEGIHFGNLYGDVSINDIKVCDIEQGVLDNDNQNDNNSIVTYDKYYYDAKEAEEEDEIAADLEEEVGDDKLQRDQFTQEIEEISINKNQEDKNEINTDDADESEINNIDDERNESGEEDNYEEDAERINENKDDKSESTDEIEQEENDESTQEEVVRPRMNYEISLSFGVPYWENFAGAMMDAQKKVHNIMKDNYTMTASAATPQYGFAKGLELFGKEGIEATYKELKINLVDRDCVRMLYPHKVTAEIKDKELHYLMFLKRKRSGVVKGRGVADGQK